MHIFVQYFNNKEMQVFRERNIITVMKPKESILIWRGIISWKEIHYNYFIYLLQDNHHMYKQVEQN